MSAILAYFGNKIVTLVLGIVAIVVGGAGIYLRGRAAGRDRERQKRMEDLNAQIQHGREAVRAGRGSDPAERLRRNDGQW